MNAEQVILVILVPASAYMLGRILYIDGKVKFLMKTLADIQAKVAAEKTVIDSAIVLLKGLADKVAALEPNQAAIDQLAADIQAQTDSLSSAVTENTPAG